MERIKPEVIRESISTGERVVRRLTKAYPELSQEDLHDAVTDAVVEWHSVGPERSPIGFGVLYRASWRNAANKARSERARRHREASWQLLQAEEPGGLETLTAEPDKPRMIDHVEALLPDRNLRVVFRLWVAGERPTQAYAAALGISRLPIDVQRKRVNREKDRLLKYLQRNPTIRTVAAQVRPESISSVE